MLTFKSLVINDVALWKSLLTSVLTFNLLAINSVALVDLYMRICITGYSVGPGQKNCHTSAIIISNIEVGLVRRGFFDAAEGDFEPHAFMDVIEKDLGE